MTKVRPKHAGSSFHRQTPENVSQKKKERTIITHVMCFPSGAAPDIYRGPGDIGAQAVFQRDDTSVTGDLEAKNVQDVETLQRPNCANRHIG